MAKWYNSIIDLPLSNFIEAKCGGEGKGNLAALIIEGLPTQEELNRAWADIQSEYSDAIGEMEHQVYIELLKSVTDLGVNYEKMQKIIPFLLSIPYNVLEDDPIALGVTLELTGTFFEDINKVLRTDFKFDYKDPEKYKKELESCLRKSKSLKMRYDIKMSELTALQVTHVDHKPVTKEYFYSILNTLEDFSKIKIEDTITVYRFCDRVRKFNKYCAEKNKEAK